MNRVHDPDFKSWLGICFDPPAGDDPFDDWYWSGDDDPLVLSPEIAAAHLLRLLDAPGGLLEMHHDNQVASGLKYVFDPGCGGDSRLLEDPRVPQRDRLEIAARVDRLYGELFARRCPQVLGHLSEEGGRLAGLAYMFWDVAWFGAPPDTRERAAYFDALIDAMGRILALPHAAAQEGALHGLGHWRRDNPPKVQGIIDRWLAEGRAARPELAAYARAARTGCLQ